MLLAIDIGNTNVTLGVFQGEALRATWRINTDIEKPVDEYAVLVLNLLRMAEVAPGEVTKAVQASVVPSLTPVFEELCQRYFGVQPLVVDIGIKTGLRIVYDNPRDVGADRVVDAVAALRRHGPPPLIVVDFGTAIVLDAISKEGDYVGGALAPGIGIAAEALFQRAAKLRRVELERPAAAIGKSTEAAMQSGIVFGYVGLVEGMVARFKEELGGVAKVVGTGGWVDRIARETPVIDVIDKDLTLYGLRFIYEMNEGGRERDG